MTIFKKSIRALLIAVIVLVTGLAGIIIYALISDYKPPEKTPFHRIIYTVKKELSQKFTKPPRHALSGMTPLLINEGKVLVFNVITLGVLKKSKSINRRVRKIFTQGSQKAEVHCFNFACFAKT